jgi:tetratricopeptide (TPR) repeat protein
MDHLNKKSDAETAYRKAIQINKGHTEALYALGLIALNKGNQKEAKEIKLAILDIDPELSEALDKEIIKSEK